MRGAWDGLPIITLDERQTLLDLARSFNEYVEPTQMHSPRGSKPGSTTGNRPGDWLNGTADTAWWSDLLIRHGWTLIHQRKDRQFWRRPDKDEHGWSATLGACGIYFYVFSSNAHPFQQERAYSPFSAWTLLEHAGDFSAAARALIPSQFAAEWPDNRPVLTLLQDLLTTPDARRVFEAMGDLSTLEGAAWQAAKRAIKGLLGNAIDLNAVQRAWRDERLKQTQPSMADDDTPLGQQAPDSRPNIIIGPDITTIVDKVQSALLNLPNAPVVYQRARRLCVIAQGVRPPKWLHRPQDVPVSIEASSAHLWELSAQAAQWWKLDKRTTKYEPALPPRWVIEALQGRDGWPFPVLEGIIYNPTLRPDGSLLHTQGYDPDTGLFLDTNGTIFPPIPRHPTLDDARTAIGHLQEAVRDFPFEAPWHFSATLAAVLSLVCRFTIMGNVPLFAIRANTPGSGKGLLADVISIIGTGRAAPRWPQCNEEEEERKRMMTIALAGYPVIHIDNVARPLGSPALELALTASSISDRLMGSQDSREVPLSITWLASGNNMQFKGDTARRLVPIDLDPKMEKPEERRDFHHDPLTPWVQQERPRLTIAALTIIRAYFEADCPAQRITPFGSFEPWSNLIRQSIIWAGETDPCEGRKGIESENNPEYERLATLLNAWAQCYTPNDGWTLAQVKGDIQTRATLPPQPGNQWNTLQEALGAFDAKYDGKTLNTRMLGDTFRKLKGRTIGRQRFITTGLLHQAQRWAIEKV